MATKASQHLPPQFQREAQSAGRGLRDAEGFLRLKYAHLYPETVSAITVARQWHEGLIKKTEELAAVIDAREETANSLTAEVDSLTRKLRLLEARYGVIFEKLDKVPTWVRRLFGAL